jgi:hypothetical protein
MIEENYRQKRAVIRQKNKKGKTRRDVVGTKVI